ncbi:metal cation symporter ZIP14-like [Ornithodoros turicata]|uniref:metal cation symporter ZIP14-like n=1 Tax=Ornithodoros turicata TaxID=34597 RepID=UPI003139E822
MNKHAHKMTARTSLCSQLSSGVVVFMWILVIVPCVPVWCTGDPDSVASLAELALLRYQPHLKDTNNVSDALLLLLKALRSIQTSSDFNEANCTSRAIEAGLNSSLLCKEGSQCLAVEELLALLSRRDASFPETLAELCPVLLFQSHQQGCNPSATPQNTARGKVRPTAPQVWGFGMLSVLVISCCSLAGLVIVPFLSSTLYHTLLMVFQGLAVGSLLGSALFHLIPQAFNLVGEDSEHDYLWKSLIIFSGIYLFYISDKVMKFITDYKQMKKPTENNDTSFGHPLTNGCIGQTGQPIKKNSEQIDRHHAGHDHGDLHGGSIATVAWMIIFGDGMHNFIDGLSIGAAFSESLLAGASISLAVFCEEFPHELGDFAVLLGAGMSMRQAVGYNFLSALTCFLGLGVGILVGDLTQGAPHIFALAAGMFLYISLVAMLGELNEALEAVQPRGFRSCLWILFLQNVGICVGLALLFVMAKYSEHINFANVSFSSPQARAASPALASDARSLFQGFGM